jgi:hypothetical protein
MLFGLGTNNSKESSQVLDRGCGAGAGSVGFLEEKSQLIERERERERVRVVGGRSLKNKNKKGVGKQQI